MNNHQLVSLGKDIKEVFQQNEAFLDEGGNGSGKLYLITLLSALPIFFYILFTIFISVFYFYQIFIFAINVAGAANVIYVGLHILGFVIGAPFLVFLLRPFLQKTNESISLDLDKRDDTEFFTLINVITTTLGIDRIDNVRISTDVVVDVYYSSFKRFRDKQLSLEIGLPLLTNMNSVELLSFISRECGYYAKPKHALCYLILRTIRSWCYRVGYNNDPWVARIETITDKIQILRVIFLPIYFAASLINKIFQLFLHLAKTTSTSLVDDMSYRADRFQAIILGSTNFKHCLQRLVRIDQAYHAALERILSGNDIPADMSGLISSIYEKDTFQTEQFIEMTGSEYFSSWHMLPRPSPRTKKIDQLSRPPGITTVIPTAEIFKSIDNIGTSVTSLFYQQHSIQKNANTADDDTNNSFVDTPINMVKEEEILRRFCSGLFRRDVVWDIPEVDKFENLTEEKIRPFLNKVVISIRHGLPEFNSCIELLDDYQKQASLYHFYHWLIKDGSGNRPNPEVIENLKLSVDEFSTKYKDSLPTYRKFYGVRVVAGVALDKKHQAHSRALTLLKMLAKLSMLQAATNDAKIKCSTLEKLVDRREQGDAFHQKTISRLTRMILKVIDNTERVITHLPTSLLGTRPDFDVKTNRLQIEQLNGADYERLVTKRYRELVRYFEAYNTAISAKLALFVEMVERKQDIESVVTVVLKDKTHKSS